MNFIFVEIINAISEAQLANDPDSIKNDSWRFLLYFVGWGVGMGIITFLETSLFARAGARLSCHMRRRYFSRLMQQEGAYFDKHKTGELTSRLAADSTLVQTSVQQGAMLITQIGTAITGIGMAFAFSWQMTLVMLACMPLLLGLGALISRMMQKMTKAGQDSYAETGALADEAISGIRTVQSFAAEDELAKQFDVKLAQALQFEINKVNHNCH